MSLLPWTAALVFVLTAAASPQTQPSTAAQGVIEGIVVNSVTGEPIPGAHVVYHGKQDTGSPISISEADGHVRFRNVAPGEYSFVASAKGYQPKSFSRTFIVQPGQDLRNVTLRLVPLSSLSGQITDEDGNGLANLNVELWYVSYASGMRELRTENGWVHTDRQGSFRFPVVTAGRYYVSASPGTAKQPNASETEQGRYVRRFYPGALDPEAAAPIDLPPGVELPNVNFRLSKMTGVTVRGQVVSSSVADVALVPETFQVSRGFSAKSSLPGGRFEIRDVLPGLYTLKARIQTDGAEEWASRSVAVGTGGLDGVELTPVPSPSLTGHIRVEGDPSGIDLSKFVMQLWQLDRASGYTLSANKADREGTVRITSLPPGRFRLWVSKMPAGFYLKEVRLGYQEIANRVLDLTSGSAEQVEMIVGRNAATVTGSVYLHDPATPFPSATVVLVPRDKNRAEDLFAYPRASADDSGRFAIHDVPPGEYFAFAWEEIDLANNVFMDPAFMASVKTSGVRLSLAEGDNATIEIPVVPEQ